MKSTTKERIEVAENRINELQLLINHWRKNDQEDISNREEESTT